MNDLLAKNLPSDDESEDEDYVPTKAELQEDEELRKSNKRNGLIASKKKTIEEIVNEMKNEWEESLKKHKTKQHMAGEINIKELLERVKKDLPKPEMIKFAGKTFSLSDNNEYKMFDAPPEKSPQPETDEKAPIEVTDNAEIIIPKVTMNHKFEYLKSLLKLIDSKNINSMTKSRYDWKDYTKKENLEKQFSENRKDGYLEKMKFLEKSKQEEKEYLKSRKKVKST